MDALTSMVPVLLGGFLASFVLFSLLWLWAWRSGNAACVDLGWTCGVGGMAVAVALWGDGWAPRRALIGLMGAAWALRLAGYILLNRVRVAHEDGRYRRLREHWGAKANRNFYFFFTSQSVLVVLFGLSFIPGAAVLTPSWRLADAVGVAVWLVAVLGEALADRQLARFRADPANAGRVCTTGLWRYSRHPNYFFEWLHWWSYVVLAAAAPALWLSLVGPAAMYLFLMRLTGIPHTEKQALASRGEAYRAYQRTTNRFFPGPPRTG